MRTRQIGMFLGICALVGAMLWLSGSCLESCSEVVGKKPLDADAWISEHGKDAEAYARRLLAGEKSVPVPPRLARFRPQRLGDAVVFTVHPGGFKGWDRGVCYSTSGRIPPKVGSTRPRDPEDFEWDHFRGPWWIWSTEFL